MKKRNIALAVGLAITMSVGAISLAACEDPASEPSPFEDDSKFAAVAVTETTHFLAGKLAALGGDNWGTSDNKANDASLRFLQNTENATLYKLEVTLYENDEFKIRYEGMPWGNGMNKGNIPADMLVAAQKDNKEGDIVVGEGLGGANFKVKNDGKYEIWLTMNAEQDMPVSVQYVRKDNAPVLPVHVSSISLDEPSATLEIDETKQLTATVLPNNADDDKKVVTWTSDTPAVATVSSTGLVTAIAEGEATITATADGKTATCIVTVVGEKISVETVTIKDDAGVAITAPVSGKHAGDTFVVEVAIAPANATAQTVSWSATPKATDEPTAAADAAPVYLTVTPVAETTNKFTVKCMLPGDYTLKATADGQSDEIEVNVVKDLYIIGQSANAALPGWNPQNDINNIPEEVRFVKQPNGSYKATAVDLYANDSIKIAFLALDYDGALGAAELAEASGNINKADEVGGSGNISILADGKYDIIITPTTGSEGEETFTLSFERVGDAAVPEWTAYDVIAKGSWGAGNWGTDDYIKVGTVSKANDKTLTASFTITLNTDEGSEVPAAFGFMLSNVGQTNDKGFANASKTAGIDAGVLEGKITKETGGNYMCNASGTYNVTIVLNDAGSFESVTFNSYTAPDAE